MTDEQRSKAKLIAKLLNMHQHQGGSEAESLAAFQKAQMLIEKFNIEEAIINEELAALQEGEVEKDEPITKKTVYNRKKGKMPTWILRLANGVAFVNRCKYWYSSSRYHGSIGAAGTESNLEAFSLQMPFLVSEVDRLYQEEKPGWLDRGEGRRWANSFRLGCASRIGERLKEGMKQAQEEMKEKAKSREERYHIAMEEGDTQALIELDQEPKYALATINTALAKLTNERKRATEWANKNLGLRRGSARNFYGTSSSAYSAGHKAGGRARLKGPKGRING